MLVVKPGLWSLQVLKMSYIMMVYTVYIHDGISQLLVAVGVLYLNKLEKLCMYVVVILSTTAQVEWFMCTDANCEVSSGGI